jgi:predicted ATP-grasp superfamily ATP-dependent carboligase
MIAANRQSLADRFRFSIPPADLATLLLDKRSELALIERLGFAIPKSASVLPDSPEELEAALLLPIIVKPRSFAHHHEFPFKTLVIRNRAELVEFYANRRNVLDLLVAQEVIPGEDSMLWKCDCTFNESHNIVGAFTFHKIRMVPTHFGVASLAVSVYNPNVVTIAENLGKALRYTGPANIEFKVDARDGQYKYIEINPRLGLCNFFDTSCGVNNAWYTYRLALGEDLSPEMPRQRDGKLYCSVLNDVSARWKDGEGLTRILRHYLTYWSRPRVGAFFFWRDPLPGTLYTVRFAGRALGKIAKRIGQRLILKQQHLTA